MNVRIDVFRDRLLAERVAALVDDALGEGWSYLLSGSAVAEWTDALAAAAPAPPAPSPAARTAAVVTTPEPSALEDEAAAAWVAALVAGCAVVVAATHHPGGASVGEAARWPDGWAALFSAHGWRFVDLIRPALWSDARFGPDAKEGWLVFIAPGQLPGLVASPPTAMLHPDRIGAAVSGVQAELAQLRDRFVDGVRPLAHRRELEQLRHRLADATDELDTQRVRQAAFEARLAATERRLLLLMEQQLGIGAPVVAAAEDSAAAPWRRMAALRRRAGRATAAAPSPAAAVSPTVIGLFDHVAYAAEHPDAAIAPLAHYLERGEALGFRPNPWFDPLFYGERNPDVLRAGVGLLAHFADYGGLEGRSPSAEFNTEWYVATYPEVRESGLNPLLHFLLVGAALGYRPSPNGVEGFRGPVGR